MYASLFVYVKFERERERERDRERERLQLHRLNGSSSPVLTATSRTFLWESQKFDPHRIETPNLIEKKIGTVD